MEAQVIGLPVNRLLSNVRSFNNTDVDYFGPLELKQFRKTVKKWVCWFTCLSVRAVHLELVDGQDLQAYLDAVYRFVARRGQPITILSDKGTNFVLAANEFKAAFSDLKGDEMIKHLAEKGIKWSVNPPAAPPSWGVWERLVQLCKKSCITS